MARKHLLGHLPGYTIHGSLILAAPIDLVLRAFSFQPSGFSRERFTVQAFAQPLYVPTNFLSFDIGNRLGRLGGGAERWWAFSVDNESQVLGDVLGYIQREGLPFLAATDTPLAIATYIRDHHLNAGGLPNSEGEGYSWLLAGDLERARHVLERVAASVLPGAAGWIVEAGQRAETILSMLQSDPEAAVRVLRGWRTATLESLHLTKYATPVTA